MNINEMVIKCKQLLQKINSNAYQRILDEEWCDIINMTINEYVRKHSYDPKDSDRDDYDVVNFAQGLQSLIRTHEFAFPGIYLYREDGKYANLLSLATSEGNGMICKPAIHSGLQYRIVRIYGSDDFTSLGASTNLVGEIFVASFIASVQPTLLASTVLEYGISYYAIHSTSLKAGVVYHVRDGSVTFPIGFALKVTADGKEYWFTGVNQNRVTSLILIKGSKFIIHETYMVQWTDYSILEELSNSAAYYQYISSSSKVRYICDNDIIIKTVPNRLIKQKDVEMYRKHSRGGAISSPVCILENNNLIVFNNQSLSHINIRKKFDIDSIFLTYIKKPNIVSIAGAIDCDLDEIVHEEIVRKTVDTINAAIQSNTYQALKTETISNTQNK